MSYQYLNGVETEIAKLKDFPAKVEANVIRGAVRAGAAFMKSIIAPLVPVRTGRLLASLRVSSRVKQGTAVASVKVGSRKKGGAFYADFVLGGTKPHLIKGRVHGALGFAGIVRRVVQHPGAKAQPFVEQADKSGRDGALKAVFDYADARTKKLIADQGNSPS